MDKEAGELKTPDMLKVSHLVDSFHDHYRVLVSTGQAQPATASWYRSQLAHLVRVAGQQPADTVRAWHLNGVEFNNGFVRALKALFRWAAEEQLVPRNPFTKLKTPPCGERSRTLTRPEMCRLYRVSPSLFRRFLFVLAHTMARPGEIRQLRWRDVLFEERVIRLTEFKGKKRRTDGVKVRTIPLDQPTARLLANMHRRRKPAGDEFVFVSPRNHRPWTGNAIRCRMRIYRFRAGLEPDGDGERVVCYTLRHTGATAATRAGVRDRLLADIMGHSRTQTTARYQHLDATDLVRGIDQLRQRPDRAG